jgi:predicted nucleic acid-binding protein
LSWATASLTAAAFALYRRGSGPKQKPLPDFFIGAHAAVSDLSVLTRDPTRYKNYFSRLKLVTP